MPTPTPGGQDDLMRRVRERMRTLGLPTHAAAKLIGIGGATLQDHLRGEHVRSDSARKYEDWLDGKASRSNVFALPLTERQVEPEFDQEAPTPAPLRPRLVVDIFSGCGGLSLGFDLLDAGRQFRTILALDSQPAPIATLNRNAALLGRQGVGRVTDLTEFLNGPEFLAFYLQHASEALEDTSTRNELYSLNGRIFSLFLDKIRVIDSGFAEELNSIRSSPDWADAYSRLDRRATGQTSVRLFHDRLRLPLPSLKVAALPRLLWGGAAPERAAARGREDYIDPEALADARAEWDSEADAIIDREPVQAPGQLSSSARRLASFAAFLSCPAMERVRDAWSRWRARRLTTRSTLFRDESFVQGLNELYASRAPVSVLVGGPPCQGFSRIGRGKIRSLREARVHAHSDREAGDSRNRLFEQYVTVLGALKPDIFLFENVAHFRSVVSVGHEAFLATELLAEAISRISEGEVSYQVASDLIDASRHGVPQSRTRYFMAGFREVHSVTPSHNLAESCLRLRRAPEASLSVALAGLPAPATVGTSTKARIALSEFHSLAPDGSVDHPFTAWVRQPHPGTLQPPAGVDGHACRAPRSDDAAFFQLLGPGRRWMDYRADGSETLASLRATIGAVLALSDEMLNAVRAENPMLNEGLPARATLQMLHERLDGALPLRLLLEQISTRIGAPHHLLGPNYLAKCDGNHGDWIARMDATRPAKTMVSHMEKDTYAYIHPWSPRTISVREAARIQTFPDWFSFGGTALTDAYKMIGNAVPPMLSGLIASRVAQLLHRRDTAATVHSIRA